MLHLLRMIYIVFLFLNQSVLISVELVFHVICNGEAYFV